MRHGFPLEELYQPDSHEKHSKAARSHMAGVQPAEQRDVPAEQVGYG